jgi:hypothetical protein
MDSNTDGVAKFGSSMGVGLKRVAMIGMHTTE